MKATALLLELLRGGVRLKVEATGLRFRAAKGFSLRFCTREALSARARLEVLSDEDARRLLSSAGY